MKKVLVRIVALIGAFLIAILAFKFIFPFFYRFYYQKTLQNYQNLLNFFPENEGINIICLEDGKRVNCDNKTFFTCGEKIDLFLKIDRPNETFYACMNMSYFNLPWICSNKTSSQLLFYEPELVVPSFKGRIQFIEVYLFPPKDYNSVDDLLADISSSKKIMSLERDVIC
ncbi:MAG: hypothetical protein ACP5O8_00760 [Candidatus Aenigmatarchaeota archaeon]